jgi:hypothetical protein
VIDNIEDFGAKFHADVFRNTYLAVQRKIHLPCIETTQDVATQISLLVAADFYKGVGVVALPTGIA